MSDLIRIEDIEVPASASDGDVPTVDSGELVYATPTGGGGGSPGVRAWDRKYRTTDLTVTSNSKTTVLDSNLDCTMVGTTGDVVQFTFVTYMDAGTNIAHFNVWTLPPAGGSLINKCVTDQTFNPFFANTGMSGLFTFTDDYILQAGDLTSGQFRLTLTVHTANVARTVITGVVGAHFTVKNLGPITG